MSKVQSVDELGVLAMPYNDFILSKFEQREELLAANRQLEELSQHDALTGIPNRRNFDHVLIEEWFCSVCNGEIISLMMIDIDHFKKFNDTYGRLVGDDCLKLVAKTLQNNIKRLGIWLVVTEERNLP